MSFFGGKKSTAAPAYTGYQTQTSASTLPVPILWGKQRIAPNIIWTGDFTAHKQKQQTGKGGSGNQATSYTYTSSLILALCQGEITDVVGVWKDQAHEASYASLGMTLFKGATPQTPWGYLTTNHPTEALGYPGVAYLAVANYDLGSSNALSNHNFEVEGLRYNTQVGGTGDADPALIMSDYLTDETFGVPFPIASIDQDTLFSGPDAPTTGDSAYQTYCQAMGFGMSPALTSQEQANTVIDRWTQLTNTALVWTGYSLKFIPYGDEEITANGVTYLPNKTPAYNLSGDDFIAAANTDPVIMSRGDPADAYNTLSITIRDRTNAYNEAPVEWKDQGLIDTYGIRTSTGVSSDEITVQAMAATMVALMGQRGAYIRNQFTFTLSPRHCRVEPMDILTCFEPQWGFFNVQITGVEETDDNQLNVTAEEYPGSVGVSQGFDTQPVTNNPQNTLVPASPINPPIILEPPSTLSGGVAQVWAAVSGGDGTTADPNWGGAFIYISTDGTQYQEVGQIDAPSRQGVLTAALAVYGGANPDTTHTLKVSLLMSASALVSVSSADAANAVTLSWIQDAAGGNGEFVSYETATLTGTDAYDLTTLYRGLSGTAGTLHAIGSKFARLDDTLFKFDLPPEYIGQVIHMKFQSFNIYGQGVQDISTCVDYTYTPLGTGYGTGAGGIPAVPTGLAAAPGGQSATISWNANSALDNVTSYQVFRAPGLGASIGTAVIVASVGGSPWVDNSLSVSSNYTYFIKATNIIGPSAASAGVNLTTLATSPGEVRLYGGLDGSPDAAQVLFEIDMVGDEKFAVNLGGSLLECDVAPTVDADFPITLNGTLVGHGHIPAGTTSGTWVVASALAPTAGVKLKLSAPTVHDGTLSTPTYTILGRRG